MKVGYNIQSEREVGTETERERGRGVEREGNSSRHFWPSTTLTLKMSTSKYNTKAT